MRLGRKGVETGSVAFPDQLIEICRSLYIRYFRPGMEHIPDVFKVCTGVESVPQLVAQFVRVIPDAAVEVRQIWVEIVVDLEVFSGSLMKEDPAATAEYLDVSRVLSGKSDYDLIPESFLSAYPGHKTVHLLVCTSLSQGALRICREKRKGRFVYLSEYAKRPLFDVLL